MVGVTRKYGGIVLGNQLGRGAGMKDENKTKKELIGELRELRARLSEKSQPSAGSLSFQERMRGLMDEMPVMIALVDHLGRHLFCNRQYSRLLDMPPERIIGRRLLDLVGPDKYHGIGKYVEKGLSGRPVSFEAIFRPGTPPVRVSCFPHATPDGADGLFLLGIEMFPVGHESPASADRICEPSYTGLAEHIPGVSILGYRPNGQIVYWNKESEDLYGYTAKEAIGSNMMELIIPAPLQPFFSQCLEAGKKVSQSGEFISGCELILRNKEGGAVPVYSVHTAVCIEGQEPLLFCTVIDFSDRKRVEEELLNAKKLEAIGVLAGGIAHDFNNLLFVILGNISMALLKTGVTSPAMRHLAEAEKACLRAKDLTQKFITFSSGGGPVKSPVCMREMVFNMTGLVLSGSHVRSRVDMPEDLWHVEVDENQMRQVLTGILANAREAMPRGGRVTIKADNLVIENGDPKHTMVEEGHYVRLIISDEGVGIPEENLAKIFDPYFSTKYRGSQKGMGFGLAIAHSVIKRHNGHIKVDSRPGEGTSVSILIPASAIKDSSQWAVSSRPVPRKRVLVMDDEEMLNELIQTMLEHLGYDVDVVLDGETAVETYSQTMEAGGDYAAVILDLTVKGGMGGREAIKKLLYLNPDVKAVVSSGYSNDPIMSDFARYGFRDVLRKPYDLEQLRVVMDRMLGKE